MRATLWHAAGDRPLEAPAIGSLHIFYGGLIYQGTQQQEYDLATEYRMLPVTCRLKGHASDRRSRRASAFAHAHEGDTYARGTLSIMATTIVEEVTSSPAASLYLPHRPWLALYSVRLKPRGSREEDEQVCLVGPRPPSSVDLSAYMQALSGPADALRVQSRCLPPPHSHAAVNGYHNASMLV